MNKQVAVKKEHLIIVTLTILFFIASLWVHSNFDPKIGSIYGAMAGFTLLGYYLFPKFYKNIEIIGIDENWGADLIIGLVVGGGFIMMNALTPAVAIGTPILPLSSTADNFLVGSVFAPFLEETMFRGILFPFFEMFIGMWGGAVASGILFSLFHWSAYGGLAMSGSLIGAFIFGFVMAVVTKYTHSLIPAMTAHFSWNTYVLLTIGVGMIIGG